MTLPASRAFWCEQALLGEPAAGTVAAGVLVTVADGVVTDVQPGVEPPAAGAAGAARLAGLTIPGLANAHSHVFHRALRGRSLGGRDLGGGSLGGRDLGGRDLAAGGDFWRWRDTMYALATGLDPETLYELARATYAEMALAGITLVGEFHYLHHGADGRPYAQPGAMEEAVVSAAAAAGLRITLLDTCYLHGGVDQPLSGTQRRFGDGDVAGWAARVGAFRSTASARPGAAVHSVRALRPPEIAEVAAFAAEGALPLHVHLSEQPAENEACRTAYGRTPTELLADRGALGPRTVAVHGTHLTDGDLALLGGSGTGVCLCPTTERDLADGIGRASAMAAAGCSLSVGSDSHAVIDLFEEARAVELDERLATGRRGGHGSASLLAAATAEGYRALGWPEGGRIAVGAAADFTTVSLATPRTAGADPAGLVDTAVYAASA
ncbi:MAG TPA: formimidoylglutamate deiminase, partial [Acidimicrobiales bacterium]|nr:formimidoylglutamate deiminase [Acidimicrobiales bacterium]